MCSKNNAGATPLHAAAVGHEGLDTQDLVAMLLEHRADVSAKDNDGLSSLHYAAQMGRKGVTRLLLENRADVLGKTDFGATPMHYAAGEDHGDVVLLLREHGADPLATDVDGETPLHWAARQGRKEATRLLVAVGSDDLSRTDAGMTPENMATACHPHVVATLKAERVRREKCEAFAMGQLERLGAGSRVRVLDPGVVRMVVDLVSAFRV
jgi:ankyrin repeat protein